MQSVFPITYMKETTDVVVTLHSSFSGTMGITLFDNEDGLPYATATIHSSTILLMPNEVIVKNYAENEGILDFLLKNNIVSLTGKIVKTGYVDSEICIIHPKYVWGTDISYIPDEFICEPFDGAFAD